MRKEACFTIPQRASIDWRARGAYAVEPNLLRRFALPRRPLAHEQSLVYRWCMSRTNIDIDDQACVAVMRRYRLATKREAVNFALRALAAEPLSIDEAHQLRGSGWVGNLAEMRASKIS